MTAVCLVSWTLWEEVQVAVRADQMTAGKKRPFATNSCPSVGVAGGGAAVESGIRLAVAVGSLLAVTAGSLSVAAAGNPLVEAAGSL